MSLGGGWMRARKWLGELRRLWRRPAPRQLRLCETLALGERRFLAVIECERQKFLIGGSGSSVALLTQLAGPEAEDKLLRRQDGESGEQP
jgi:flagellar biogenesis protein FliO